MTYDNENNREQSRVDSEDKATEKNNISSDETLEQKTDNNEQVNPNTEDLNSNTSQKDSTETVSSERGQSSQQHATDNQSNQRKRNPKIGVSAIIGGLTGALVTVITMLVLLFTNIISIGEDSENQATPAPEAPKSEETVSTDLSNDDPVDFSVDDATKAVVGVNRLQQRNIWEPTQEAGTGSGIIYKKEKDKAYVVTNHHVVAGAEDVEVTLHDEKKVGAKVLGSDELADLAVLEIDGSDVDTVAKLGHSENIEVGETVIAIGNPLGMEFSNSLTKGIISGLNRSVNVDTSGNQRPDWVTEVIQTDAAINPGNSGGALVNTDGEVIGINSMKIAQQAVEGIGFAIPIDTAKPIMEQLETDGKVSRPYIGVSTAAIEDVPFQYRDNLTVPKGFDGGLVVANVEQGSPADKADLKQFDIITEINGEKVESILDLRKYLYSEANIGQSIEIKLFRDGEEQTKKLELTERIDN